MQGLFSPKIVYALDILALALMLFGFEQTRRKAGLPVVFANTGAAVVVETSQFPALQPGDTLIAIEGKGISSKLHAEHTFDEFAVGASVELTVQNGVRRSVAAALAPVYSDVYQMVQVFSAAVFFSLGVFAVYRRRNDRAAYVFHWLVASVALLIMCTWGNYPALPAGAGIVLRAIFPACYAAMGVFFLHFSMIFPVRKRGRRLVRAAYLAVGIISVTAAITELRYCAGVGDFHTAEVFYTVCGWLSAGLATAAVLNFYLHFRVVREESERRKILWILFGSAVSVTGYFGLWLIPNLLDIATCIPEETVLLLGTVAPVTFAIAIVRYRALDIEFIINRGTVYAIVFFFLLMIYALVEIIVFEYLGDIPKGMYIVISFAVVVVDIALFDPARGVVQTFVDKRFFRVRYNIRLEQRRLAEEMVHTLDVRQLGDLAVRRCFALFPVEYICFVALNESGGLPEKIACISPNGYDYPTEGILQLLTERQNRFVGLPAVVETGADFAESHNSVFRRGGVVLAVPMNAESGELLGFIAVGEKMSRTRFSLEDIDLLNTAAAQSALMIERFRLQQKFTFKFAEAKRLEELNAMKSLFVAGVTHELKTPLTSIIMFAELLRYSPPEMQKKDEYCEIIGGEASRLARLINTVLDFSKVERGVKEYNFSDCSLNEIAERTVRSLQYQISMLGFTLETEFAPDEPLIYADADAIAEIIINFISNAMKYSPESKGISLTTEAAETTAALSVKDSGIGIPGDIMDKIFEPYFRADAPAVQRTAGAGLGLSLVKHIADAHGATIHVVSSPETGSTFTIIFPRKEEQ